MWIWWPGSSGVGAGLLAATPNGVLWVGWGSFNPRRWGGATRGKPYGLFCGCGVLFTLGDVAGLLAATPNGVYVGGATRRVALRATCG